MAGKVQYNNAGRWLMSIVLVSHQSRRRTKKKEPVLRGHWPEVTVWPHEVGQTVQLAAC